MYTVMSSSADYPPNVTQMPAPDWERATKENPTLEDIKYLLQYSSYRSLLLVALPFGSNRAEELLLSLGLGETSTVDTSFLLVAGQFVSLLLQQPDYDTGYSMVQDIVADFEKEIDSAAGASQEVVADSAPTALAEAPEQPKSVAYEDRSGYISNAPIGDLAEEIIFGGFPDGSDLSADMQRGKTVEYLLGPRAADFYRHLVEGDNLGKLAGDLAAIWEGQIILDWGQLGELAYRAALFVDTDVKQRGYFYKAVVEDRGEPEHPALVRAFVVNFPSKNEVRSGLLDLVQLPDNYSRFKVMSTNSLLNLQQYEIKSQS